MCAVRVTVNPDTKEVEPLTNAEDRKIYSGDEPVRFAPTIRVNQPALRMKYDTSTGQITMEQNQPTGYQARPISEHGAIVRNSAGMTIPLSQAKPSDVVDLPGKGDTSVAGAVQNGWLVPAPSGVGYMLPGAAQPQSQAPAPDAPKQDAPKQEDAALAPQPGDLNGVPPTSAQSDVLLSTLRDKTPMALEGIISSLAAGKSPEPIFTEVSRQLGDEYAPTKLAAMHGEFLASGQQALRNVGVEDPAVFEEWARSTHREEAGDAIRELVTGHNVARLQALGRRFVAQSNERLAQIIQSKGVETRVSGGTVMVKRADLGLGRTPKRGDFGNDEWSSLRDMIREDHISIG
jgi:hypothetical protein